MKPTISLAMIVKDEEEVLDRCLSSTKDLFDEIIIVDTGSTDRTKEIASRYTSKIYDFEWVDDFSAARNYSFDQCTCDWIFWMDADDEIPPESAEKIRKLDFSDVDAILLPYLYYENKETNDKLIVPRERFLRRSSNPKWCKRIHEYVGVGGWRQKSEDILLVHFRIHGTSERNIRLLELSVDVPNPDLRDMYYLAKEYQDFGRVGKAVEWYEKYVVVAGSFWEDVFTAWYRLAQCYKFLKDEPNFKRAVFESIKMEPRRAEPYCLLGEWWMDRKSWERAIHWYRLAAETERSPELISSYQTSFYTWLPHLQLTVCYNNIGNTKKAYYHNERVLEYSPNDQRAVSNKKILWDAMHKKRPGGGKKLNLGAGGKPMPGYTNVDIYDGNTIDEVFDLDSIPYEDGTIGAIYSEHSLEHVGHGRTRDAIKEWFRVLKPGGELLLKMPDLEQCCRKYVESIGNPKLSLWYKYTIYGYQKSLSGEPDEAQIHRWGYSLSEMHDLIKETGFVLDYTAPYDGWDTPSFSIRAVKPVSPLKIGWVNGVFWDSAQVRLRCLNVDRWLRSRGYRSSIVPNPDDIINEKYDVAILGKAFDANTLEKIRWYKSKGVRVFIDICEDLIGWDYVDDILRAADRVVCCSRKLEEKVRPINHDTMVIEEAWES